MRFKSFVLVVGLALALSAAAPALLAQEHGQEKAEQEKAGPQPDCPYGYFDFSPYDCAPYGYYGPSWFQNGSFVGIGPWFHGPKDFHGQVDDHFNPHHGYKGNLPRRGEQRDQQRSLNHIENFTATDERDGKGNPYREHSH